MNIRDEISCAGLGYRDHVIHGKRSLVPASYASIIELRAEINPFFSGMVAWKSRLQHTPTTGLHGISGFSMRVFDGAALVGKNAFLVCGSPSNSGGASARGAGSTIDISGKWSKLLQWLNCLTGGAPFEPFGDFPNNKSLSSGAKVSTETRLLFGSKKWFAASLASLLMYTLLNSFGGHVRCEVV